MAVRLRLSCLFENQVWGTKTLMDTTRIIWKLAVLFSVAPSASLQRACAQYASLRYISPKLALTGMGVTAKIPAPPLKISKGIWWLDIIWTSGNFCSWLSCYLLTLQHVRDHSPQCSRYKTCEKKLCIKRNFLHRACFTWRVTSQIKLKQTMRAYAALRF